VRPLLGPKGRMAALDILPIEPIKDVDVIQGDFREAPTLHQIEAWAPAGTVDIVLSDMAPNISGIDAADQAASVYLAELAMEFAASRLKPGGVFLVKLFQGGGYEAYVRQLRTAFASVQVRKPKASRARSREVYLLARTPRVM
jgi:23S rRNA (uridine2552-2'-O)-methyltransferase